MSPLNSGADGPRHPRRVRGRFRPLGTALGCCLGISVLLFACQDVVEPPSTKPTTTMASAAAASTMGAWGNTFSTGIVALHASLVPLGAGGSGVLAWGHVGVPHLWNLADQAPTFTALQEPTEIFCSAHTFLPDGSLLVVGGHDEIKGNGFGIPSVQRFVNGAWVTEASMSFARWYPSAVTLPNGDVLVYAGTDNDNVNVAIPERYSYATHSWSQLTNAPKLFPWYPRSFIDPKNGQVFYAGQLGQTRWLDPEANGGLGQWGTVVALRQVLDRSYGAAAMYDAGKILYAGGGGGADPINGTPPTNAAEIIDLNQPTPAWTPTAAMAFRRRHANLTILADGKVLVNGGTASPGFTNTALPVKEAELWDPATGQWTLMASESVVRVYHSTALLLPDGRVLSAGSGDGYGLPNETTGQIFSPPYLFRPDGGPAARPTISFISATELHYGQSFDVRTPNAAAIAKVHLIRFSSVTHAFNQGQLLYRAAFTRSGGNLKVIAPPNGRVAPPGPYLLFIVHNNGVPSVAKLITLSP